MGKSDYRKNFFAGAAAALLMVVALALPARAEPGASDWLASEQGKVRLVAGGRDAGGELLFGLQFDLAPGWKIYWRAPGDAGYPPQLDWAGSENFAAPRIEWPAPMRFSLFGIDTVGYHDQVLLPLLARPESAGAPVKVRAAIDFLTCKEICVPQQGELALDLADPAAPQPFRGAIEAARARVPHDGGALRIEALTFRPGDKPVLEASLSQPAPAGADAFVEGPPGIGFGRPEARGAALLIPVSGQPAAAAGLAGRDLTVTVVAPGAATERTLAAAVGAPAASRLGDLAPILLVAIAGGLLLNIMPCVLPVLSIKLLSLAGHAGRERQAVRLGFLATAAGVLFSFALLAGAMVALKSAGLAVGWGVQFQQPVFLVAMVALVSLFALNLWGLFEISLPGWAAGLAGTGPTTGLAGEFLTGAFATLLATPCSAPFLGTAVGFALAGGAFDIWAVFLALGIGFALPYLLVAALPSLARLLPRPGRWMLTFRRVLSVVLALTAVWLLSVVAVQIGLAAAVLVGASMLALGVVLALVRHTSFRPAAAVGAVAVAVAVALLAPPPAASHADAGLWRPFDRAVLQAAVADGKVVLVDVTAEWCLTCQVNKKLVLYREPIQSLIARGDVVAMRADWTRPDPSIGDYLRSFGRYGIPFNAAYGPKEPNGEALSEILTERDVLAALRRAGLSGG